MFQIYLAGFLFMCGEIMLNAKNVASDNKDSEKPNSRAIINGYKSVNRPFYVQLADRYVWFCGGSIIGENFILTAAHCLFRPKKTFIIYGDFTSPNGQVLTLNTTSSRVHEDYDDGPVLNDVAIIKTGIFFVTLA